MERKAFLLSLLLMLFVSQGMHAQHNTVSISGNITNAEGKRLGGVSVYVKVGEETFGNVSDRKGRYDVTFTAADTVTVTFSHVSYAPCSFTASGREDIKKDITLSEKSIALKGVEVEAKSIILGDHVSYIPTKKQVNGANSGVGLLFNMMIPQIDVNPVTGDVQAADKTPLTLYIDGRKASIGEIDRLRPKDVARVEYMENPSGKFAGERKVVNYITKQYESGGYVDVRTKTQMLFPQGNYTIQAKFDRKNVSLLALAGTSFSHEDYSGTSSTRTYQLNPAFTKTSYVSDSKTKKLSDHGLLQLSIKGKRSFFVASGQLRWNETPKNFMKEAVEYTNDVYPSAVGTTNSYSKSLSPRIYIYHSFDFNKSSFLSWQASYDYSRNNYRRSYEETNMTPVLNDVKENYHSFDLQANYILTFKNGNSLGITLWEGFTSSKSDYLGTSPSKQKLYSNDFQILPTYNHKFGQKFDLGIQMGFNLNTYKVNDNDNVTKIWLRPSIYGNYMINNSNYLSFYGNMGSVTPQMAMLNGATQYISEYEMMRGNPDLKTGTVLYGNISYSKYWNNVSLSAYVNYNGCLDIGNKWYTIENNKLISTFRNCGDWHSYNIGVNSVFQVFNKSLQLRLTAALENTNVPGYYDEKSHRPVFGANLFYSIGEFSFSGFYNTPKTSLNSGPMYTKEKCNYGLTATWNHRGLFVQLGCQRIFDGNGYNRSYYDYGCYKFDRRTVNNSIGQIAYISLSYSFDFGRQVKREKVNINTSGQSGILRP